MAAENSDGRSRASELELQQENHLQGHVEARLNPWVGMGGMN
jgi:hypothetical protein